MLRFCDETQRVAAITTNTAFKMIRREPTAEQTNLTSSWSSKSKQWPLPGSILWLHFERLWLSQLKHWHASCHHLLIPSEDLPSLTILATRNWHPTKANDNEQNAIEASPLDVSNIQLILRSGNCLYRAIGFLLRPANPNVPRWQVIDP